MKNKLIVFASLGMGILIGSIIGPATSQVPEMKYNARGPQDKRMEHVMVWDGPQVMDYATNGLETSGLPWGQKVPLNSRVTIACVYSMWELR